MIGMISMFDKNAKYTKAGESLDVAIKKAIDPIMRAYVKQGCSVRDVYTIAELTAKDIMTEIILDNDMEEARRIKA